MGQFHCVSNTSVFLAVCFRVSILRLTRFGIFCDPPICETFTKFKNLCTKLEIIKTVDVFISVTFARNNKFYMTIDVRVLSLFLLTSATSYFIDIKSIWWFLNAVLIPKELGTPSVCLHCAAVTD